MKKSYLAIIPALALLAVPSLLPIGKTNTGAPQHTQTSETVFSTSEEPIAVETPPAVEPAPVVAPEPVEPIVEPTPEPTQVAPAFSDDCRAEIAKYDWIQRIALDVAQQESGFDSYRVNNNPNTGDYSVGCFQINILGNNAIGRPSEAELKNAIVNVAYAYHLYKTNNGWYLDWKTTCTQYVVCR